MTKLLIPNYELLTLDDGWKKIENITINDKIATLNNNNLEYNNPIKIDFLENLPIIMCKIQNKDVDIDIPIIHRLLTKTKNDKEFKLTECKDFIVNNFKYKRNVIINKKKFSLFDDNKVNLLIQLQGIWFANAWYNNKDLHYYISVNEKTSHVLCNILNRLNYKYNIYIDNILIENNYYCYLVRHYKIFPKWIWELDQKQSRLFLDMILLKKYNNNKKINYKCENIDIMDDMMRLCINAGLSSTFNYNTNKLTIYFNYHEPIVNNNYGSIYDYDGLIYSIIVPNETIMVRKNGKTLWL
jgi:hypothetical protein